MPWANFFFFFMTWKNILRQFLLQFKRIFKCIFQSKFAIKVFPSTTTLTNIHYIRFQVFDKPQKKVTCGNIASHEETQTYWGFKWYKYIKWIYTVTITGSISLWHKAQRVAQKLGLVFEPQNNLQIQIEKPAARLFSNTPGWTRFIQN